VIFGGLSLILIYSFGKYLFDWKTGALAAAFLGGSQLGVAFSQEARPYAQLLFAVLCCSYLFVFSLRTGRAWWAAVCMACVALYTHYYASFAIASFVLFWYIYRDRYRIPIRRWIAGAGIIAAGFAPWVSRGHFTAW